MNTLETTVAPEPAESDAARLRQYARTGDAEAFARLVAAYAGMVFATARRITRDTHLAEDVTQSAFLALARDAGRVRTNVAGWLHGTATHRALDVLRTRRRADAREHAAARDEAKTDAPADPSFDADWADLLPEIDRAIAALPADLRLPLVLHFLQSRSQADVAAELGVDASTVSRRIGRAVEALRAALRRRGFAAPAALPAALGTCGPAPVPAALGGGLVKIGLGGVGVAKPAGLAAPLLALAAAAAVLFGVILWNELGAAVPRAATPALPRAAPAGARAAIAIAAPPATAPTTRPATPPPAVELIRDAIRNESWIAAVNSVSIDFDVTWHASPQTVADRTAALAKQFAGQPITPERFPELRPATYPNRIAFDGQRAMVRRAFAVDTRDLAVCDGNKTYHLTKYAGNDFTSVAVKPTVGQSFEDTFVLMAWLRATEHRFWFIPPRETADTQEMLDIWEKLWPESAVRGPVYYRGKWCWVVVFCHQRVQRWYVGMDDHRLYGLIDGYVLADDDPRYVDAYARAAAARGGTVHSTPQFWAWQADWSAGDAKNREQSEFERLMGDVNINLGLIDASFRDEFWMADYREVAPGRWMPFRQGIVTHTTEKGVTVRNGDQEVSVTNVRVDQPLPDEWFAFSLAGVDDGTRVYDATHSPALSYKWKKNRTPAEWQQVFDEAAKRQADQDARQAALNKIVGRPAPAFGNGEWLNGPVRSWADFTGRVTLVDFWAEWCGPCVNDLPALVRLAGEPGIAVVGVHTAGSRRAKIDAHLRQFGITYPVYVDRGAGDGFGALMDAFGVRALPQTFVIDAVGRVTAQGSLGETLPVARRLAREAATRAAPTGPGVR